MKRKQFLAAGIIAFFVLGFCVFSSPAVSQTFFGPMPTGLVELDERYPVFMYVPQNYKADRNYPMMVVVPDASETAEEHIQKWTGVAQRTSMILLCATNLWPEDTPYSMDEWLLEIKNDLIKRYRVNPTRVYLTGFGAGAHYAAYLGVNYPKEFSAVGLIGGSWTGQFEKLLRFESRPKKQLPFLIVVPEDNPELMITVEKEASDIEGKGYMIALMKTADKEALESMETKKNVLEWMRENSQVWSAKRSESGKSLKEKTYKWMEEFLSV